MKYPSDFRCRNGRFWVPDWAESPIFNIARKLSRALHLICRSSMVKEEKKPNPQQNILWILSSLYPKLSLLSETTYWKWCFLTCWEKNCSDIPVCSIFSPITFGLMKSQPLFPLLHPCWCWIRAFALWSFCMDNLQIFIFSAASTGSHIHKC